MFETGVLRSSAVNFMDIGKFIWGSSFK